MHHHQAPPPVGVLVQVLKDMKKRRPYESLNESEFQSLLVVMAAAKSAAGAGGERRIKEAIDDFYEGWREMKEGFADLNIPSTRLTQKFHREGWQLGYLDEQLEMISESLQPEDKTGLLDDAGEKEEEDEDDGFGIEEFIGSVGGGRRGLGSTTSITANSEKHRIRNPSPPRRQ